MRSKNLLEYGYISDRKRHIKANVNQLAGSVVERWFPLKTLRVVTSNATHNRGIPVVLHGDLLCYLL